MDAENCSRCGAVLADSRQRSTVRFETGVKGTSECQTITLALCDACAGCFVEWGSVTAAASNTEDAEDARLEEAIEADDNTEDYRKGRIR